MGISNLSRCVLPLFVLVSVHLAALTGSSTADQRQQLSLTPQVICDFDALSDARNWTSVNDDVMGGRSDGTFKVTPQGVLEFYGNLSLENRGGFASVRSKPAEINASNFNALDIRLRGDGRPHYCYLRVSDDRFSYSYWAKFDTEAANWKEVLLPLKEFQATWRGRTLPDAPALDANKIRSVGFLIADKKAGPFKLEVDWVATDKEAATAP